MESVNQPWFILRKKLFSRMTLLKRIVSVQRLLNRFKKYDTVDRKPGPGRPWIATLEKNEEIIENLTCPQEENSGTCMSPGNIKKYTGVSCSSKKNGKKKRIETIQAPENATNKWRYEQRRTKRADALTEGLDKRSRSIEKYVWEDVFIFSYFTFEFPLNLQNGRVYVNDFKNDVQNNHLFHQTNKNLEAWWFQLV